MMPTFDQGWSDGGVTFSSGRRRRRAPDQAVVGADPDQPVPAAAMSRYRRSRRAADPWSPYPSRSVASSVRRNRRLGPRQIGADRRPGLAAVARAEQPLVAEIKRVIALPEGQRQRPVRRDIRRGRRASGRRSSLWPGLEVEPFDRAAIDDVWIVGVGRDLAAFAAGGDLMEMRHGDAVDLAVAAARHRGRARILLRAVDPIGEAVVGRDMVELAGRLVVPAAPGLARR